MKLLQDSEDSKAERKSLKPQVERRRRERMNRSLESLKTLLLQRQGGTQHRVEKAEILEHTVVFLQNTAEGDKTRAGGGVGGGGGVVGGGGGGGGRKHSFQDGFSTCLQTTARFLGPEGKGLWLGAALDASLAARFPCSDSDSAGVQRRTEAPSSSSSSSSSSASCSSSSSSSCSSSSGSLRLRKSSRSILRLLIHRSGLRLCTPALTSVASCVQTHRESHLSPTTTTPPQPHKEASRSSKQSPSQSQPLGQTLWRPWP
ncbi:uncharacterized protein LOC141778434 [Sebastes fasciatus]|uniref:uncharacterized protein LOC141778434 n=1 Tax=Sebastes fasciatus TaxID=394691 RepID=UPI003D9F44C5